MASEIITYLEELGLIDNGVKLPLYKYRNFQGAMHLETLAPSKNEAKTGVWFATPASFNDPYDCQNPAEYFSEDQEKNMRYLQFLASKNHLEINEVIKNLGDLRDEKIRWAANFEVHQKIITDLINIFGLSKEKKSTLMWSHYALNHTGFAIGYNIEALINSFGDTNESGIEFRKVKYDLNTPKSIDPLSYESFHSILTVKHEHWKYEKEYRFIYLRQDDANGSGIKKEVPTSVIESITFGFKTSPVDEARLRQSISHWPHQPRFYRMKRRPYSFELDVEQA